MSRAAPEAFEIASLLLRYPAQAELDRDPEVAAAAGLLPKRLRGPIERFLAHRSETPAIDLEQEYVETFDTRRRCTLNVSYYLYGDTRRRGVALLRLKRMYAAAGLVLDSDELPDHLPVMLEFAALAPPGTASTCSRSTASGSSSCCSRCATPAVRTPTCSMRCRRRCRGSGCRKPGLSAGWRPRGRPTSRSAWSRSRRPR